MILGCGSRRGALGLVVVDAAGMMAVTAHHAAVVVVMGEVVVMRVVVVIVVVVKGKVFLRERDTPLVKFPLGTAGCTAEGQPGLVGPF